jgi:predicted 2-oxoglutarate/Fe(II)-dependent dioxygenase YbiX
MNDTEIKKYLDNKIKDCVNDYLKNVVPNPVGIKETSTIRFNRYQVGTNMKFHHDHIHALFDGEKKGVPILSILGLLNDDFEDGDFLMFDAKKVQLEAGDIILFPSNFLYPHAVATVTKGTRYSFVSWGY